MAAARKSLAVPQAFTLLYEFANSLDLRRFVQAGVPHTTGDKLATIEQLEEWMRGRGLLDKHTRLSRSDHRRALELREALRQFLSLVPPGRRGSSAAAQLNAAASNFPLVVRVSEAGELQLHPETRGALSGLGRILADLQLAGESGNLDRLKMCASEECRWVFYDRSKPATRRWCSSMLCGNREKIRTYRTRRRQRARLAQRA
jgi:predicted RNA-binding Zn ribbon-like protein